MTTSTTPAAENAHPMHPVPMPYTPDAAMDIIHHFTTFFSPADAEEALWQLLVGSMGSAHGDGWSAEERSNLLLFCRLAGELAGAVHCLHGKGKGIEGLGIGN